jgi:hypothetical protein
MHARISIHEVEPEMVADEKFAELASRVLHWVFKLDQG